MRCKFPDRLFVTGSDTGVGKTLVSALLLHGLDAYYWKPVQSGGKSVNVGTKEPSGACDLKAGSQDLSDSAWLRSTGIPAERIFPERFLLSEPLSPHLAARLDGLQIELSDFSFPPSSLNKPLVVEGAGGLLVPLNDKDFLIDLILQLNIPVILVTRSSLGTINHTLLSLEALRNRGAEIFGVVMNGEANHENRLAIEKYGKVEVLAEIPPLHDFDRLALKRVFENAFSKVEKLSSLQTE